MNPSLPADPSFPQGRAPGAVPAADADAALLRRMAAGDESALGLLYDRWSPLVHSVVARIAGDADDAEELVEETFLQAWRQAGRYEGARGGVSTWLAVIARSRALDRVRLAGHKRAAAEPLESPESPGSLLPDHDTPLAAAEIAETRQMVHAALQKLPPDQRETLELAYFRGMSQSEIAEATGQPLGTVKTRCRLGLQKLREALSVLREDGA
ncbi:MAG TPA: sigma-70 family RNA polymerase sigma factor [Longimicrobium sp.]|nr:sigma-70 family RNA polymerase sigma factor [Longimicrobium sp.]